MSLSSSFRPAVFGLSLLVAAASASTAGAAPDVVTSIKPLGSLVSMVTGEVTTPYVLVQGNGSPHDYALKPTDAAALERASLVIWAGPELEVFLQKPLETLAGNARVLTLSDVEGLTLLDMREGGMFEADEHDHGHDGHADEQEHEGEHEEDHAHGEGHDHDEDHDNAHEAHDAHIWLDPDNAVLMVGAIASALEELDPDNAATYQANAQKAADELRTLSAEIEAELSALTPKPFVVFHDGYHYFEHRFGVEAAGSITVNPETAPGAQRLSEIHDRLTRLGAACVFAEPQFTPKVLEVVTEGTNVQTGVLDPLGAGLADGPDLYPQLLRNMAESLRTCFAG